MLLTRFNPSDIHCFKEADVTDPVSGENERKKEFIKDGTLFHLLAGEDANRLHLQTLHHYCQHSPLFFSHELPVWMFVDEEGKSPVDVACFHGTIHQPSRRMRRKKQIYLSII
jgi:hypothetical protein